MEELRQTIEEMSLSLHKRMADFEGELQKPSSANPTTANISIEFNSFKAFVLQSISCLQQQADILAASMDKMEMRGRRKMLLFHGIKEEPKEVTSQVVMKLIQRHFKKPDVAMTDIKRCHRLGRSSDSKNRPIACKFHDLELRDSLWYAKTVLKGSGITISEFLTKPRHNTFVLAREKFGISRCWTRDGWIHILGDDGTRHRVSTVGEVNKLQFPDKKTAEPASKGPKPRRAAAARK